MFKVCISVAHCVLRTSVENGNILHSDRQKNSANSRKPRYRKMKMPIHVPLPLCLGPHRAAILQQHTSYEAPFSTVAGVVLFNQACGHVRSRKIGGSVRSMLHFESSNPIALGLTLAYSCTRRSAMKKTSSFCMNSETNFVRGSQGRRKGF